MSHYRLHALNDIKMSCASGSIVHDAEVVHNHANDSFLADLKGLKGTLASGDLIKYDGANLVAKASSDFATAASLDDYLPKTQASTDYVAKVDEYIQSVVAPLSVADNQLSVDLSAYQDTAGLDSAVGGHGYIKSTDEYVQSVSGPLSVAANQLSIDLSAYQDTAGLDAAVSGHSYIKGADQYIQTVAAPLSVAANQLSVDLSAYQDTAGLDSAVSGHGYIKATDQFVQSVGSNLSMSGSELNVDLSSCLTSASLSGYLQTADLGSEIANVSNLNVQNIKQGDKWRQIATLGFTGSYSTAITVSARNYACYHVKVKAVWESSSNNKHGVSYFEGIFKKSGGSVTLYADTDSSRTIGDAGSLHIDADGSNNIAVQVKSSTATDSTGTVVVSVTSVEALSN